MNEAQETYLTSKIINAEFKMGRTIITCDAICNGCPFDSARYVCGLDEFAQNEFILKYYPEHLI